MARSCGSFRLSLLRGRRRTGTSLMHGPGAERGASQAALSSCSFRSRNSLDLVDDLAADDGCPFTELEDVHDARIRSDEMHSTPRPHTVRVPPRRQVSATAPSGSFRRLRRRGHRQSKRFRHSTRDPAARRTPPHDFSGAKAPRVWVRRVDGLICDATLTMLEHRAAVYVQ